MPTLNDFPARGKVSSVTHTQSGDVVVFKPSGTSYQMHLVVSGNVTGGLINGASAPVDVPIDVPIDATIRVTARKMYSVSSGGNFVQPIFGQPRIIQGRVMFVDAKQIVVHAGANFVVTLPDLDNAIDLENGSISVGMMVNVVAKPGATCEIAGVTAGA